MDNETPFGVGDDITDRASLRIWRWNGESEDYPQWVAKYNSPLSKFDNLPVGKFIHSNATLYVKARSGIEKCKIGDFVLELPDGGLIVMYSRAGEDYAVDSQHLRHPAQLTHYFSHYRDHVHGMEPYDVQAVRKFHNTFGVASRRPGDTDLSDPDYLALRVRLILEESGELIEKGLKRKDPIEVADGGADTLYVTAGTEIHLGLPRETPFTENGVLAMEGLFKVARDNLIDAVTAKDAAGMQRSLLQYRVICQGLCDELCIPLLECFKEVHRSNMTKVWPDGTVKKDAGGKVIKPPSYSPADITGVLEGRVA